MVIAPSHVEAFPFSAIYDGTAYSTPLGEVAVDREFAAKLAKASKSIQISGRGHGLVGATWEHAVEVQLPFLQRVLAQGWTSVPLAVGATAPEQVADVLDSLCVDDDLLPVVSTDLSHYLDQVSAQMRDRRTAQAVVDGDGDAIGPHDACGGFALRGLLHWARRHDLDIRLLQLSTSADTGGDPVRVVGYAAFALLPPTRSLDDRP